MRVKEYTYIVSRTISLKNCEFVRIEVRETIELDADESPALAFDDLVTDVEQKIEDRLRSNLPWG